MKFKTNKDEILDSLSTAQYFISTGSTLPLLSNILFEAEGENLYLSATDMDIYVRIKSGVNKIEAPGRTTIPKKIIALIKEFSNNEIKIEADKNDNIKVQCKKSSYKIHGLPAEDFPVLRPDEKKLETVQIPHNILKEIIKNISYAALRDNTKRNLNGVFMRFEGNKIEAVATDAHRLAVYTAELKTNVKAKFEYIIPLKTINEVAKVLKDEESKMVEINFYEKMLEFKIDEIEIITRVIDENYPNYAQVVPKEFNMVVQADRVEFEGAVKRAAMITSEKAKAIMIKLDKNKMYISAQAQDEGEAFEELDIAYDGDPVDVSYNAVYLMDVLKVIETDKIEIKLISSVNPGVLKPAGDENFTYVVMPIRK